MVFKIKKASTLRDIWAFLKKALLENQAIEAMVWRNLQNAKFKYQTKDLTSMDEWTRKNNGNGVNFTSTEWRLGIIRSMSLGRMEATGYDLSKIEGFDHRQIVEKTGWEILSQTLMDGMAAADYAEVRGNLELNNINHTQPCFLYSSHVADPPHCL